MPLPSLSPKVTLLKNILAKEDERTKRLFLHVFMRGFFEV